MASESSHRAQAASASSTSVARRTHGSLAEDAAACLRNRGYSTESIGGVSQEIPRQSACLVEWARQEQVILDRQYTEGLVGISSSTAEHVIFYRASDNRAVKRTHPGCFGVTPDSTGAPMAATPLFYLERLRLMNVVFGSDLRMEGICMEKSILIGSSAREEPCIVISQPWIDAADARNPHPAEGDIGEFMKALRFLTLPASYFGWHRIRDGIIVLDAKPDNFIASVQGIIPIDLVVSQRPIMLLAA